MKIKLFLPLLLLPILTGCQSVGDHRRGLSESSEEKLTVGVVQKEIKNGMAQADVAKALGSPNLVTKDKDNIETWIYDKVSTTIQSEAKSEGATAIGGVFLGILGVGGKGSTDSASGTTTTSQKTLTLIIKFRGETVDSFATRMSSF